MSAPLAVIRRYDTLMAEADLADEQPTIATLEAAGYTVDPDDGGLGFFVWSLHGEIFGDDILEAGAWVCAAAHWIDAQPLDCPQCGTQAVCNECLGGVG